MADALRILILALVWILLVYAPLVIAVLAYERRQRFPETPPPRRR